MAVRWDELEWQAGCMRERVDSVTRRADAGDPCWASYEQAGMKEKDGRTVPNCVEADEQRADAKPYEPKAWKNGWSRDETGFMTGPGNPAGDMRAWWVEGTSKGISQRVEVQARNHNEAVTIGSKKHMLVVTGAGLK